MPAGGDSYGGCSGMGGGGMGSGGGGNSRGGNGGEHNYNGGSDSGGGRFSNIEGYKEGYYDGKLHIGIKYEAVSNYPSGSNHGGNAREGGKEGGASSAGNSNGNFNNAITKNSHKVSLSINPLFYDDSFPMGKACIQIRNALEGFLNPNEKVLNSINKFNSIYRDMEINNLKSEQIVGSYESPAVQESQREYFGYWQKIIDLAPELLKNVNEQKASDAAAKVLADKKAADDARIAKEAAIKKAAEEARVIKEAADKKAEADRQAALIKEAIEKAAADKKAAEEAKVAQEAKAAADAKFKTVTEQSNFDPEFVSETIEAAQAKMEKEAEEAAANPEAFKAKQEAASAQKAFKEKEQELKDRPFEIAKDYIEGKLIGISIDTCIDIAALGLIRSPNPISQIVGVTIESSKILYNIYTMGEDEIGVIEDTIRLDLEKKHLHNTINYGETNHD